MSPTPPTAIRLRAETRAGELLRETAKTGQRKGHGQPRKETSSAHDVSLPTLRDLGITRDQSSTWQKLAAIPAQEFCPVGRSR